jgi:hypothetical protein
VTAAGRSSVSLATNAGISSPPNASLTRAVSGIAPGWMTTDVTSGYSALQVEVSAHAEASQGESTHRWR